MVKMFFLNSYKENGYTEENGNWNSLGLQGKVIERWNNFGPRRFGDTTSYHLFLYTL